jgi:CheY-like chemotaxis protein
VKDTGIGIPADRLAQLFKPFTQVDASTTRKFGGTGLGLTICKRLVEMMGGSIWVESETGEGSVFHFTIIANADESRKAIKKEAVLTQLEGRSVLIVDDNEVNRFILIKQIESWGMVPIAASGGSEALPMLKEHESIELAILDMMMPEMDGLMLAARIRELAQGKSLPLILLSSVGAELESDIEFFARLVKPVKASRLLDVIGEVFGGKDTKSQKRQSIAAPDSLVGKTNPLRILVAEDNAVNQKVALRMLERLGYRADVVSNGLEAVEAVKRGFYDVVLMDVEMPEMDGPEATRQLRAEMPANLLPRIIATTAKALSGDREKLIAEGMDDYLSKPIRLDELENRLNECRPLLGG